MSRLIHEAPEAIGLSINPPCLKDDKSEIQYLKKIAVPVFFERIPPAHGVLSLSVLAVASVGRRETKERRAERSALELMGRSQQVALPLPRHKSESSHNKLSRKTCKMTGTWPMLLYSRCNE